MSLLLLSIMIVVFINTTTATVIGAAAERGLGLLILEIFPTGTRWQRLVSGLLMPLNATYRLQLRG